MTRISDLNIPTEGEGQTEAINAAFENYAGDFIHFDNDATYEVGRLYPKNGTKILMSPGVHFRKRVNTGGILRMDGCEGVELYANGATLHGEDVPGSTSFGHTAYANGTKDCVIEHLVIDGSSLKKDGLYLGRNGTQANENLTIRGGKYLRADRNNISVVAAHGTKILDAETAFAVNAPGCGIDVEANIYGDVSDTYIEGLKSHDNKNGGVVSVFGVGTTVKNSDLYDNGVYGFALSSGAGQTFAEGNYRKHVDMCGITAFDPDGVIRVSARPPVGTAVSFAVVGAGVLPPEFRTGGGNFVVSRWVGADGIILGRSVWNTEVRSISAPASGILSFDPAESHIRLRVFAPGQSDGGRLYGGKIYRNGQNGLLVTGSGDFYGEGTEFFGNLGVQVQTCYTRDVELCGFKVYDGAKVAVSASGGGGKLLLSDMVVENCGGKAMHVSEWTQAMLLRNVIRNCGFSEISSGKAAMHLVACLLPLVERNRVSQLADNLTTLFGIYAEHNVIGGRYLYNDCTGAGTTNTNSMIVPARSFKQGNTGRNGLPI